jgi:uncharacterized membrane protein
MTREAAGEAAGTPTAPLRPRGTPGQLVLVLLGVALAVLWPFVLERASAAFGGRGVAGALVILSAASLALTRSALPRELRLHPAAQLALLALSGYAVVTGDAVALRLVPAWVQLAVASVFLRSLAGAGPPVIERVVFWIQPHAPEFIRPYCRTETQLWGALFATNGLAIAALALLAPADTWRWFASAGCWLIVAAVSAFDFAFRKLYFRLYGTGPLDRVLERLFPPGHSEASRRANAYRTEKRLSLGRDAKTGKPIAK